MGTATDGHEFTEIDRDECLELLRLEEVARLGLATEAGPPDLFPVNYLMHRGEPIFRTHRSQILERTLSGPVTLQADRIDWAHRTGWSVMVQGPAELVDPADLDGDVPDSWLPGDQDCFVRVAPERVTGRRIVLHQDAADERGYL